MGKTYFERASKGSEIVSDFVERIRVGVSQLGIVMIVFPFWVVGVIYSFVEMDWD